MLLEYGSRSNKVYEMLMYSTTSVYLTYENVREPDAIEGSDFSGPRVNNQSADCIIKAGKCWMR